jgi:hypothetical protein
VSPACANDSARVGAAACESGGVAIKAVRAMSFAPVRCAYG